MSVSRGFWCRPDADRGGTGAAAGARRSGPTGFCSHVTEYMRSILLYLNSGYRDRHRLTGSRNVNDVLTFLEDGYQYVSRTRQGASLNGCLGNNVELFPIFILFFMSVAGPRWVGVGRQRIWRKTTKVTVRADCLILIWHPHPSPYITMHHLLYCSRSAGRVMLKVVLID